MIKLKSVRHTGVPVMDVDKAREFYGKILGFTEIPRPEIKGLPGIWYECNGTQVHIIGQRNEMAMKGLPGIGTHIALQVENLEEAKKVLKRKKIKFNEFTPPPHIGNAPVLFLRDPDGNVVELRTEP
jgi:catechol 2,3-dioxygenase-like lactoylglutathione lyase family enzyme